MTRYGGCYNPSVNSIKALIICAFVAGFFIAGCAPQAGQPDASSTPTLALILYQTVTPPPALETGGGQPLPTSTPFIYVVVPNDTFFSIAANLNIDLNALLAANPDVNPSVLLPGMELVIPADAQVSLGTAVPTIAPVPVELREPVCYSSAAKELWCFVLAINSGDRTIENLTGVVQLTSANGDVLTSIEVVAPLDILAAGAQMPLVAYLQEMPDDWVSATAQLFTAYWLPENEAHYIEIEALDFDWDPIDDAKLGAYVQGQIDLKGNIQPQSVWVLGVAYDASGNVVGVRRWESEGELVFDFWVYSLGPQISDVRVLVEARP